MERGPAQVTRVSDSLDVPVRWMESWSSAWASSRPPWDPHPLHANLCPGPRGRQGSETWFTFSKFPFEPERHSACRDDGVVGKTEVPRATLGSPRASLSVPGSALELRGRPVMFMLPEPGPSQDNDLVSSLLGATPGPGALTTLRAWSWPGGCLLAPQARAKSTRGG